MGLVYSVAFDHEGRRLVSASQDSNLTIWDLTADRPSLTLAGHTYYAAKGIFSRDGRRVVSASHDQSVKMWDVTIGRELLTLRGHEGSSDVAISPDGQRIASAGRDGVVRIWDAGPDDGVAGGGGPITLGGVAPRRVIPRSGRRHRVRRGPGGLRE